MVKIVSTANDTFIVEIIENGKTIETYELDTINLMAFDMKKTMDSG